MQMTHRKIKVVLSGGCELLFDKEVNITLADVVPVGATVAQLIDLLRRGYVKERPELFVDATGANVRPGILVLVNGCDAEVLGGVEHVLEDGDEVEFVSTLHGG